MAHHEDSHDDHGHDMTEGNRQYYPKGWYLPLVGLFVVAFFFSMGGGALLGISGTDKWGHVEYCTMENCDGHCGMEHMDMTMEGDHHGDDHNVVPTDIANKDSATSDDSMAAPTNDCVKVDSPKVEAHGGGH